MWRIDNMTMEIAAAICVQSIGASRTRRSGKKKEDKEMLTVIQGIADFIVCIVAKDTIARSFEQSRLARA